MEEQLIALIYYLVLTLVVFWMLISISLYYRYNENKRKQQLKEKLTTYISENYTNIHGYIKVKVPHWLQNYIKSNRDLKYVALIIIGIKDFFVTNKENWSFLFATDDSISSKLESDIKSNNWYKKARAIWISYELDIDQNIDMISKLNSHKHILVRREAQIALVRFLGWKSLRILPYVKYPLSLWQQIRIVEKLHDNYPQFEEKHFSKALKSENPSSRELCLRIIRRFDLSNYNSYVINELFSEDEYVANIAQELVSNTLVLDQEEITLLQEKLSSHHDLNNSVFKKLEYIVQKRT